MDLVFLDTNVLFSAAYRPDARLRRLWKLPDAELITSAYAVEEARRNLDSPKQRLDLEKLLRTVKVMAATPVDRPLLRLRSGQGLSAVELPDKDLPILLAAIDAKATHLLTGDFSHFGSYYGQAVEGVLILPPADYLRTRRS